jgi:hypothetical protein
LRSLPNRDLPAPILVAPAPMQPFDPRPLPYLSPRVSHSRPNQPIIRRESFIDAHILFDLHNHHHLYQHYHHPPPHRHSLSRTLTRSPTPIAVIRSNDSYRRLPELRPTVRLTASLPQVQPHSEPTSPTLPLTRSSDYLATLSPDKYRPPLPQPHPASPPRRLHRSPLYRRANLEPEELLLTPPPSPPYQIRAMSSTSSSLLKRKVVIMGAPSVGESLLYCNGSQLTGQARPP